MCTQSSSELQEAGPTARGAGTFTILTAKNTRPAATFVVKATLGAAWRVI